MGEGVFFVKKVNLSPTKWNETDAGHIFFILLFTYLCSVATRLQGFGRKSRHALLRCRYAAVHCDPLVRCANRPPGHKSRIRNVPQSFVRLLNSRTLTDWFNYDLYLHQVFFRISFSFVTCLSTFRRENKSCVTTRRKCSCKLAMITSVLGCAHTNTN